MTRQAQYVVTQRVAQQRPPAGETDKSMSWRVGAASAKRSRTACPAADDGSPGAGAGPNVGGEQAVQSETQLADDHVAHVVLDLLRHADEPVAATADLPDDVPHEEPA